MFSTGAAASLPDGSSAATVDAFRLDERPLEQLPLSRNRFALSGRLAHRFAGSTIRLFERLYADDWGVTATTTDARFIADFGDRASLGPTAGFIYSVPQISIDGCMRSTPEVLLLVCELAIESLGPMPLLHSVLAPALT